MYSSLKPKVLLFEVSCNIFERDLAAHGNKPMITFLEAVWQILVEVKLIL